MRTGVNEYICVDGWIPRCFRVYASNLFILPLSRKHSAEITVWKDTVLSAEGRGTQAQWNATATPAKNTFPMRPGAKTSPNSQE